MAVNNVVSKLVEINAINLNPASPYTWASGWLSPIYCDNRRVLSFPEARTLVCNAFVDVIKRNYPEVEVIAGVATGAIAHGVLVANALNLPFVYIRSEAKKHGLENLIEGVVKPNQKVVVVEDLVSTGLSSLKAVNALRDAKTDVLGMVAIFTYGFDTAKQNFESHNVDLHTLANYFDLIDYALAINKIDASELDVLKSWRSNPSEWGKGRY